ncbi:MAG: hypothetical protein ABI548_01650 [Polyangiaceae bacterium]
MNRGRELLKALDEATRLTGKTRREVFDGVHRTWNLSPQEKAWIIAEIARAPEVQPADPAVAETHASVRAEAKLIATQQASAGEAAAFAEATRYLETMKTNPVAAAHIIKRGGKDVADAVQKIRDAQKAAPPDEVA